MRHAPTSAVLIAVALASVVLFASRAGWSQPPDPTAPAAGAPAGAEAPIEAHPFADPEKAPPPPSDIAFLQYGVAFTAEVVAGAGPICDNVGVPCILGPGGGVAVRAGRRGTGALYFGGAYELSKQDPNKLYRLAILQQVRGEGRWYFATGRDVEPFAHVGLGVAGYGNEWAIDTFGPAAQLGGGLEAQITTRTVVGISFAYRVLWFKGFTDTSGADRAPGLAQMIGLDLLLEQRDPLVPGPAAEARGR